MCRICLVQDLSCRLLKLIYLLSIWGLVVSPFHYWCGAGEHTVTNNDNTKTGNSTEHYCSISFAILITVGTIPSAFAFTTPWWCTCRHLKSMDGALMFYEQVRYCPFMLWLAADMYPLKRTYRLISLLLSEHLCYHDNILSLHASGLQYHTPT